MRTLDQLGGPRVRRRSDTWHEPAHSISVTVHPSRSVRCLRCLCRMMLRGRGSRSLTRFWAWTADFEPCGCASTWLYKYAHHQPVPHRNHVGGAVWVLRCERRDVTAFQQAPNQRVRNRSHSKEPPLNPSHVNVFHRVQIHRGIDRGEPKSYLHGGTFENRRYLLATRSMSVIGYFTP